MNQFAELEQGAELRRLSPRAFDTLAVAFVFLSYMAVFLFMGDRLVSAARASIVNLVPLLVVSVAARALVARHLVTASLAKQLVGHIVLAAAFTLTWYWLLMVGIGIGASSSPLEFAVRRFFDNPAIAWQLLQGIAAYAVVAAITYLQTRPPLPTFLVAPAPADPAASDQKLSRYFIRIGEDIRPLDVADIVSISGADDYAEVSTTSDSHLVRMTLAEFEQTLDPERFVRIHRSRIVNVERIDRAEPAGNGRILVHMDNGEMVQASRAGSKLLRDRVI